jgi:hypothetical protein
MQRQALSQLDGGLSRRLLALRDDVIQLEAWIAYDIDFPEEDDGPIAPATVVMFALCIILCAVDLISVCVLRYATLYVCFLLDLRGLDSSESNQLRVAAEVVNQVRQSDRTFRPLHPDGS